MGNAYTEEVRLWVYKRNNVEFGFVGFNGVLMLLNLFCNINKKTRFVLKHIPMWKFQMKKKILFKERENNYVSEKRRI